MKKGAVKMAEWISVKDRLPKEHDSIFAKEYGTDNWNSAMYRQTSNIVAVCYQYDNGERVVEASRTTDGRWINERNNRMLCRTVTHWMPLPEPPEV